MVYSFKEKSISILADVPIGSTARPPFGQKIVPIFWPGQAPTLGPGKLKFSLPPVGKITFYYRKYVLQSTQS
jgi:hypothetical protein